MIALSDARALIAELLQEGRLAEWLVAQRWFASKRHAVAATPLVDAAVLDGDPALAIAIVQAEFASRDHQLYQLPFGV